MNPYEFDPSERLKTVDRPGLSPKYWISGLIILTGLVLWFFAGGPIDTPADVRSHQGTAGSSDGSGAK